MNQESSNPYVGLRPFEIDESILFFGRNDQTLELLQRLHMHHFVAVVGGSGSGKSSLLRAGLIPSLKAGYLVNDSDHWLIAIMKPGQSPLYNLAESLLNQLNPSTTTSEIAEFVLQINEEGVDAILNKLKPGSKENNINFFLLVDQFEEIFRFSMEQKDVSKKDEAIDFVSIMLELSQQNQVPFFVVMTMRSDFIGDCVQFNGLAEAMNQSQYLVPRLNRVQMKAVIEGPARLFGSKTNPTLTSRLLNDSAKVKDELPLLQHALMRIWEYELKSNKNGELDIDDYESIGGIENALSIHADEALQGMEDEELLLTKKTFQALTSIDENGRKIRRPVLLSQLIELTGSTKDKILHIIDLFIKDSRSFLIINNTGDSGDKVIDISHESLIRQWKTLNNWVDEEADAATAYLQLNKAAKLYRDNKKDLLTGSELQLAHSWYLNFNPSSVWANRYRDGFEQSIAYLNDSVAEREKLLLIEKSRKKRLQVLNYSVMGLLFILIAAGLFVRDRELKKEKTNRDLLERYKTEQRNNVMKEVNNIIERANKLKAEYPDIHDQMIKESLQKIHESMEKNELLKNEYNELIKKYLKLGENYGM